MGAKAILAKQYFAPIFLDQFDESCVKFCAWKTNLSFKTGLEKKKQIQKRMSTANEVQELIRNSHVLGITWISNTTARIVLSTGVVLLIFINQDCEGQEVSFRIHRFLVFDDICQVAWAKDQGVFLTNDGKVALFKWNLVERTDLIRSDQIPNLLPAQHSKRVERQLVMNESATVFAIWWSGGGSEVFPWNPKPEQRANILVYSMGSDINDRPFLTFHKKTDGNLLSVNFPPGGSDPSIILLEDYNSQDKSVIAAVRQTRYDLSKSSRISEIVIPLSSQMKCFEFDRLKDKLCLGLCNASIVIVIENEKVMRTTKLAFVPRHITWHENSLVVLVVGSIGQVQLFDIALNPLFLNDSSLRLIPSLTTQLEPHRPIFHASWGPSSNSRKNAFVLLGFESGNLSVLNLYTGEMNLTNLISRHLEASPVAYAEAIKVLQAVPWNADLCRTAFHLIFSRLRVEDYSEGIEQHFEDLFETYFLPKLNPLETIWAEHRDRILLRAQSYHHWLFLAGKFKRSLEVAAMTESVPCVRKVLLGAKYHGVTEVVTEAETILENLLAQNRASTGSISRNSWCSTCSSSVGESRREDFGSEPVLQRPEISSTQKLQQFQVNSEEPQLFPQPSPSTSIMDETKAKSKVDRQKEREGPVSSRITVVSLGDV